MQILINVPDDYELEDGDAFDAVQSALEHFEIPSSMVLLTPDRGRALTLVAEIASLSVWEYANNEQGYAGECCPPSEGYRDSHQCLMSLIDQARAIASPVALPDDSDAVEEAPKGAPYYLQKANSMSTEELDDWYESAVGYRPSVDDPALVGNPEHAYLIAETMCLHDNGPREIYGDLCILLEELRTGTTDGCRNKYFAAPPNLLGRLKPLPGKHLGGDYKQAVSRLCYPYFELSKEEYEAVARMAGGSDILLLDGCTQVTFGASCDKYALMPLHQPV